MYSRQDIIFRQFWKWSTIFYSELQVTIDLEPEVAGNDSAAELSGLLQDPHFLVYFVLYTQSYPYSMTREHEDPVIDTCSSSSHFHIL